MSLHKALLIAAGLSALLSSCTSKRRAIEVAPQKQPAQTGIGPEDRTGTVVMNDVLKEDELKKYGDTTKMEYKFMYLSVSQQQPISFTNGAAQVTVSNLPVGQSGTVTLEVYESSVLKLRGSSANVTLTKGAPNKVSVILSTAEGTGGVNPGSGGTGATDLTIDVTLDGAAQGSSSGQSQSGGAGNGGDPLGNWDGKSNRGNSRWQISPI